MIVLENAGVASLGATLNSAITTQDDDGEIRRLLDRMTTSANTIRTKENSRQSKMAAAAPVSLLEVLRSVERRRMRETNQLTNRSWSHVIGQLAATTLATRLGLFNKWEDCTFMQGCDWSASRRYGSCQVRSFKPIKMLQILCTLVIGRRYCWVGALCSNIGWYFSKKISTVMHTEGTKKKL